MPAYEETEYNIDPKDLPYNYLPWFKLKINAIQEKDYLIFNTIINFREFLAFCAETLIFVICGDIIGDKL